MYQRILAYISNYISLNQEETDTFTSFLKVRKLLTRQFLLQAGDICKTENFVNKGCLKAFYIDMDGNEHIVQFALEDWWISDLHSFLTQTPAVFHIEVLENCELIQIDYNSIETLYTKIPKFERFFRIIFQKAYIAAQQRVISTISKTAEERYLEFIQRYPNIEQRVPQYMVASYLGFTPEFLSKIRYKLIHSQ